MRWERFKNISSAFRQGEDITLLPDTDPWHFVTLLGISSKHLMIICGVISNPVII